MADRYWRGGSGTWDATTTTNWSATSGGAGGASAPTSADNVIFNSASNATLYTVTVGTNAACADMTAAGPLVGNVTFSLGATAVINCYGSFTLAATGITWTAIAGSVVNLKATTTGKTITTNGISFGSGSVTFDGIGGEWTLGSALTLSAMLLTNGTFNSGNFNITGTTFTSNNANTRTLTLGLTTYTLSGGSAWNTTTTTGLTFNAGTSTISLSGASPAFQGGGLTFYNVSFTNATAAVTTITGANTFNNLTQTSLSATGARIVSLGANQTVLGTLTLGAANQNIRRVQVISNAIGTQRTITLNGTLATLADCDFRDIATAGSVGTWTGIRLGNGLNNSGITFTTAKDVYWNSVAGGNWTQAVWALSSGGATSLDNLPLAQDKIIIENTGLNSGASVNFINGTWWVGELDISTRTLPMTFTNGSLSLNIYKNVTLSSVVTMTGTNPWQFFGQSTTQILDVNTATFVPPITIDSPNGTLQLAENTTCSATVTLTSGTLNLNNNVLNCTALSSNNANTRSIAFGTGNITLTGSSATVWSLLVITNFSYTGTPTVNLTYAGSTGTRIINNGGSAGGNESNAVSFNISAGSDTITFATSVTNAIKNLNFTGFTGILSNTTRSIYGNLIISSGMTLTAGTSLTTFSATSGTQLITTNGNTTIDFPITQNGVGGTVQLQDNLTIGSTRTYTLTAGTLNLSSGNRTLSTGLFNSSSSNTRSIAFGKGNITLTGSSATIWTTATSTNFSYTGTPTVNCTYAGSTGTRTVTISTSTTEAQAVSFNVSAGSDSVAGFAAIKNLNFTGFTGTLANSNRSCYGNVVFNSGMTCTAGALTLTFAATSGTQQITTAGQTIDFPLTFNGLGGTFAFQDALTMGGTRTLTLSAGSLLLKSGTTNTVGNIVLAGNSSSNTRLSATEEQFAAFLQKVVGGTITASNITIQNSTVTPIDTWYGDPTTIDGGNNTNWNFEQTAITGHDAFLPQEIRHFKELDRKAREAEANRIRAAKLVAYHRKRRFKELLAPELINPNEDSFYEELREQQFPEEVAKEKAEQAKEQATAEVKAKVEAKKRELKKELKRLEKEEKEAEAKVAQLQREKELLVDSVIARQKAIEIQTQLAIIYKLQQEEMEDEQTLLLLI